MTDPYRAHCPTCDGARSCKLIGHTTKTWSTDPRDGGDMHGGVDHSLLECLGCETVFYEASSWHSEDIDHWYDYDGTTRGDYVKTKTTYPKPESKSRPSWVNIVEEKDSQLGRVLDESYSALDAGSRILASIGLRTALDRASELLGVDPALSFPEKLNALENTGWIGSSERDSLDVVTNAGNAAAHRGWSPSPAELRLLFSAMELFLQKAFVVENKTLKLKARLPAKPKRRKTA